MNCESDPAIAWSGSEFGVTWTDTRVGNAEIYFARIGADGTQRGEELRVTVDAGHSAPSSIGWGGQDYVIVWRDHRDAGDGIYSARIGCR